MKNIIKIQIRWLLAGLVSFSFLNVVELVLNIFLKNALVLKLWHKDLKKKEKICDYCTLSDIRNINDDCN